MDKPKSSKRRPAPQVQKPAAEQTPKGETPLGKARSAVFDLELAVSECQAAVFLLGELESGDLGYLTRKGATKAQYDCGAWLNGMCRDRIEERMNEAEQAVGRLAAFLHTLEPAPAPGGAR